MTIQLDTKLSAVGLAPAIDAVFAAAGPKIRALAERFDVSDGAPVFTVEGRYAARGWTDWTLGFQIGSALLHFDASGDPASLDLGRRRTLELMAPHVTHHGVHDHGFHNVSTYGNLLRLMAEGRIPNDAWERRYYELALQASGAVQASRWTSLPDGLGYVYSFNGPHSLFADTIRSMRVLVLADRLGGKLLGEGDRRIDLFERALVHAETTARFNVFFGEGRDRYDVRGRVAHESIFNLNDGAFRCPSTQQGYSPFTTWTRALAWILLGYAELLEFADEVDEARFGTRGGKSAVLERFEEVARATADYYIASTPTDGVPYWDTGAPGLAADASERPADPFGDAEPVDSSAAAIAAQGLLRLGHRTQDERYTQAGLKVAQTLFQDPYLSTDPAHEGLLLHSVYHRPNAWDHQSPGSNSPRGEATMWGDYHLLELALLLQREAKGQAWLSFFGIDAS